MPSVDALLEAEKRGILPEDKKPLLAEARKRGLVPAASGHNFDAAQQAAYDDEQATIKKLGRDNAFSGTARRMVHSGSFGADDEILAGVAAVAKAPYNAVTGGPGLRDSFNQEWARQQAHLDNAREQTDGYGLAVDLVGGFGSMGPKALAAGGELLRSGAELAPTIWQSLKQGGKVGTAAGGAVAFNEAEGSVTDRLAFVPEGMVTGLLTGTALAGGLHGAGAARGKYVERKQARAEARGELPNARAAEFAEVGVPEFTPALTDNPVIQGTAQALQGTIAGGSIRNSAQRSISALEQNIMDTIRANGGVQTTAEAGEATQSFLRRNIVERSTPSDQVKAMTPEQLQDISTVAPGPLHSPAPPKVPAVAPRDVQPIDPEEYLATVRDSVRAVQPKPVQPVQPLLTPATPQDVVISKQTTDTLHRLSLARQTKIADYNRVNERSAANLKDADDRLRASGIEPQYQNGKFFAYATPDGREVGRPRHTQEARLFREHQDALRARKETLDWMHDAEREILSLDDQIANMQNAASRERGAGLTVLAVQREREALAAAKQATKEATAQAEKDALVETERLRQEAVDRARPAAEAKAAERTREAKVMARAEAEKETQRLQNEANVRFAADQEQRAKAAAQPIEIGKSAESYPTEFDAAYRQVSLNTPTSVQPELLMPGTETSKLINQLGLEARRQLQLPGYKKGQGLTSDLSERLRPALGGDISTALERYSQPGFKVGIEGMYEIRTKIGQAIADARSGKFSGETRGPDEATLARLYKAVTDDIQTFTKMAGGDIAAAQRQQVDAQYRDFMGEIRAPLAKVFGDNVTPEQAMERLIAAAGTKKGDSQLLRAFYKVVDDKGDRLIATNAILHRMAEGGVEGFLKTYRALSTDAKNIMFHGAAAEYGRTLDKLARVGGYLENYLPAARESGGLDVGKVLRPGNIALGLTYFINIPSLVSSVVGAELTARLLSSQRFAQWLRGAGEAAMKGGEAWQRHAARASGVAQSAIGMDPTTGDALGAALVGANNQGQQNGNVTGMETRR